MRLVRFQQDDGPPRDGVLDENGQVRPLPGGPFGAWEPEGAVVHEPRLLAPLAPPNIFAIGRNYAAHASELGNEAPAIPLVFQKPTTTVIGPGAAIELPAGAPEQVDYEAELAVVIGRTARRVSAAEADEYVLGYTCANDITARDCQRNEKQWTRGKGFDTFCPLGPWIVPAASVDAGNLRVVSRLNGAGMQDGNTGQMIHSVPALVSYLSHQFTLLPGTLILTGTPAGVGSGRTPPVFLSAGDRIEVEIEGIGTLANPVVGGV